MKHIQPNVHLTRPIEDAGTHREGGVLCIHRDSLPEVLSEGSKGKPHWGGRFPLGLSQGLHLAVDVTPLKKLGIGVSEFIDNFCFNFFVDPKMAGRGSKFYIRVSASRSLQRF